ncbi:MAG: hypothetical protein K6F79_02085 [Saccharofermentans sp.]|nr:hypothetical protein [Saccharofermentans sp.]
MKLKKFMSLALAAAMVASVAGCAKVKSISSDDFISACDKQDAQEVDYDDANDADPDDLEDGLYTVLDSDQIEEIMDDPYTSMSISQMGVEIPYDSDDIESMVIYAKMNGVDDIDSVSDPEDLGDIETNGVVGVQITMTEADMVPELFDAIADAFDDGLDYEVDSFSGNEYYTGKNEGYLRVNISVEDLVAAFRDSDIYGYLGDMSGDDMDDLEDVLDNLTGNLCVAVYAKGENIVIVVGFSIGSDVTLLDSFCSDLGVQSPSKVPANADLPVAIMDAVDDSLGSLMSMYSTYAVDEY